MLGQWILWLLWSSSNGPCLEQLLPDYLACTHKPVSADLDCDFWKNKYITFHLL